MSQLTEEAPITIAIEGLLDDKAPDDEILSTILLIWPDAEPAAVAIEIDRIKDWTRSDPPQINQRTAADIHKLQLINLQALVADEEPALDAELWLSLIPDGPYMELREILQTSWLKTREERLEFIKSNWLPGNPANLEAWQKVQGLEPAPRPQPAPAAPIPPPDLPLPRVDVITEEAWSAGFSGYDHFSGFLPPEMKHEGCRHIRRIEGRGQQIERAMTLRFKAWRMDIFDHDQQRIFCEACWRERKLAVASMVELVTSWYQDFTAVRYLEVDPDDKRKMAQNVRQYNAGLDAGQTKIMACYFPLLNGNYIALHDWPEKYGGNTLPRHRMELYNLVNRWAYTPPGRRMAHGLTKWAEQGPARRQEQQPARERIADPSELAMTREERAAANKAFKRMQAAEKAKKDFEESRWTMGVVETKEWRNQVNEMLGRPLEEYDVDLEKLTLDGLLAINRETGIRWGIRGGVKEITAQPSHLVDREDLSAKCEKTLFGGYVSQVKGDGIQTKLPLKRHEQRTKQKFEEELSRNLAALVAP